MLNIASQPTPADVIMGGARRRTGIGSSVRLHRLAPACVFVGRQQGRDQGVHVEKSDQSRDEVGVDRADA
jgi:hypothetical protein